MRTKCAKRGGNHHAKRTPKRHFASLEGNQERKRRQPCQEIVRQRSHDSARFGADGEHGAHRTNAWGSASSRQRGRNIYFLPNGKKRKGKGTRRNQGFAAYPLLYVLYNQIFKTMLN